MKNLAGVPTAGYQVREELFLAGIPTHLERSTGEVPYDIIGRLHGWTFRRAWYYYIASCGERNGLPYDVAVELHETGYPIPGEEYHILGEVIRVYGHAGGLHPKEGQYPTLASMEAEFVKARVKFPDIPFNIGEAFDSASLRELGGIKYVRLYHIDTMVGLVAFVNVLRDLEKR